MYGLTKLAAEQKRRSKGYEGDDYVAVDAANGAVTGGALGLILGKNTGKLFDFVNKVYPKKEIPMELMAPDQEYPILTKMPRGEQLNAFGRLMRWHGSLSPLQKKLFVAGSGLAGAGITGGLDYGVTKALGLKSAKGEMVGQGKDDGEWWVHPDDSHIAANMKIHGGDLALAGAGVGLVQGLAPDYHYMKVNRIPMSQYPWSRFPAKYVASKMAQRGALLGGVGLATGAASGAYQDYLDAKHDRYDRSE